MFDEPSRESQPRDGPVLGAKGAFMSAQSNPFQRLVAMLTDLIGGGEAEVVEPYITPDPVSGRPREVDVVAIQLVGGHEVRVGIECRDRTDVPDVRWVEEAITKFDRLRINLGVLVSSSGFSEPAREVAAAAGLKTITPGAITREFAGEIVNNLNQVEAKRLDFRPTAMRLWVATKASGADHEVDVEMEAEDDYALWLADGQPIMTPIDTVMTIKDYRVRVMLELNRNHPAMQNAIPGPNDFTITLPDPVWGGDQIHLLLLPSKEPMRIKKITITGDSTVFARNMALTHGDYDGTSYATGAVELGDARFEFAAIESPGKAVRTTYRATPPAEFEKIKRQQLPD